MTRPRLLDLFCGAGGAAMGYYRAGFEVVGVDINPQKHYPFEFHQGDALEYCAEHGREFDVIHASPPCQRYSKMNNIHKAQSNHPDLIDPVRSLLIQLGCPFVIENVVNAPIRVDLMLCGSMFGLKIIRHRIFESNVTMPLLVPTCHHEKMYDPWHGNSRTANKFRDAIGIDWMPLGGWSHRSGTIGEAIPPAYTEFIGKQILKALEAK